MDSQRAALTPIPPARLEGGHSMKKKALLRSLPLAFVLALGAFGAFTPKAAEAAICPLIGCVDDQYCRRNSDCTAGTNGVCNLFCPTRGCCRYS
jgi:hypothetical protein